MVRLLQLFVGGGYDAVAGFIEKAVPAAAEQQNAATSYIKILESAAFQAYTISQTQAGKTPKNRCSHG